MRDFCILRIHPLFLLGNRQFTFIAHNLDVAEDVVGQICHRHIRLRPYNPYCPDNKAVHTLLFKTEYVLDKATGLGLAPVLSLLFFCQRMIPTAFSQIIGFMPCSFTVDSCPAYPASRYKLILV